MKKYLIYAMASVALTAAGCSKDDDNKTVDQERGFVVPEIAYVVDGPESVGRTAYMELFGDDPQAFLSQHVDKVVKTIYANTEDPTIPRVARLRIIIDSDEHTNPAFATTGSDGVREIHFATFWPEGQTEQNRMREIEGIVFHELTHIYQHNIRHAGDDGTKGFIEGMADAVRPLNIAYADGDTGANKPAPAAPREKPWERGYRDTGWFLVWLVENKDPDFLRKFNATAVELERGIWTWDAAVKSILGSEVTTQALWDEYLASF